MKAETRRTRARHGGKTGTNSNGRGENAWRHAVDRVDGGTCIDQQLHDFSVGQLGRHMKRGAIVRGRVPKVNLARRGPADQELDNADVATLRGDVERGGLGDARVVDDGAGCHQGLRHIEVPGVARGAEWK